MSDTVMATLITHDGRQAVILPDDFRLPGTEVRVPRSGDGLHLEPVRKKMSPEDIRALFAEMDRIGGDPIFPNGREQPPMPPDDDIPSFD